ncbi:MULTISPECIES: excinuclease ABC subunit UvrC [Vitreoscilla]|uniref:UvrABC system protein C n=1 Tax=Vitreoscilla stercoraria TaxID=61 RepID=A0ABY4EBB3_VITST|nr:MULTISPECIES: excinuclease ABC subunit UvrC [Vitreoscilla]AUZ05548.1 subunit C of UvrABC system [Vitreoscilla sp. C1]UOO93038.1 excinuclease ABC subunit UvrC [Vitreoscilla stercoraria]
MSFDIAIFVSSLPQLPGVYRMFDAAGQVLYVGKAVNLKKRVGSYFQKTDLSPRIQLMLKQVAHIEITVTRSEAEALVLENNFIKALSPKYNILFRDDKTYPYLILSEHEFARMVYHRGSVIGRKHFFGPYPNGQAVRQSMEVLQKVFQLRTCEDSVFANRQRPCLLHQIKRCSAPCVGLIEASRYQEVVQQAIQFLQGKTDQLLLQLQEKMQQAAEEFEFEKAAVLRDQIVALGTLQSQQYVDMQAGQKIQDIDILSAVLEQGLLCVHWSSVRGGRLVGDRHFFPEQFDASWQSLEDSAQSFVAQHYLGKDKPKIILSDFVIAPDLQAALNQESSQNVVFITQTTGQRKVWLEMAQQNARIAITQKLQQKNTQLMRLDALASVLNRQDIQRLECFDISHTQGEATVASCVVYDDGAMQPSQYRRFNIQTTAAGDDYAAMKEVLLRRYGGLKEAASNGETVVWPDVVLIDGGKGQVAMAMQVWQELDLNVMIVGIAKGPERKAGLEELILAQTNEVFSLPAQHPALHLLQTIRDEAHRFAITGHRNKRAKTRLQSNLLDIPGIGPKRRKNLLTRFGGLRGMMAASKDDIAQVDGISAQLAQIIYDTLHSS